MRWYVGLGLGAAALAVALFAWSRDDDGDRAPQRPAERGSPDVSSSSSDDSAAPPRVMPRQRTMPRAEARPPVPPAVEEAPADPADPPAAIAPSEGAAPNEDPELTRRVDTANQRFEEHDFEATAALAQEGLEAYPESFWLRSLAVKSFCALGNRDRAKELIAEEPRLSQRKRLRVHCQIQIDRWN